MKCLFFLKVINSNYTDKQKKFQGAYSEDGRAIFAWLGLPSHAKIARPSSEKAGHSACQDKLIWCTMRDKTSSCSGKRKIGKRVYK